MFRAPFAIPQPALSRYKRLRLLLWIGIVFGGGAFILSLLFPTITQSFEFDNPGSSRNTIVEPRAPDNTPLTTGKITADIPLVANTSLLGDFSSATIRFTLEDDSPLPETVNATLRRAYRSLLLPSGEPISAVQPETVLRIDDNYYIFENNTLFPFVSEAAYRSRFDTNQRVMDVDTSFLENYPRSTTPIGFRVGSLLSFADGVFVVTSNTEIRPIGSAEILLALGYRFEDVKPASEEELSLYTRGRIILLNTPHADGTVFRDLDTNEVFMIENGKRHVITDEAYRTFLEGEQAPIPTRSQDREEKIICAPEAGLFPRTYSCEVLLDSFRDNLGSDYELLLETNTENFEMETLTTSFHTHVTLENARTLAAKVKNRILVRFGLAQP